MTLTIYRVEKKVDGVGVGPFKADQIGNYSMPTPYLDQLLDGKSKKDIEGWKYKYACDSLQVLYRWFGAFPNSLKKLGYSVVVKEVPKDPCWVMRYQVLIPIELYDATPAKEILPMEVLVDVG